MNPMMAQTAALCIAALLAGCSTVDSSIIQPKPASDDFVSSTSGGVVATSKPGAQPKKAGVPVQTRGIAYFLPRQLARVTAKRSEVALEKEIEALGKAELAVSVAEAQVSALKVAIKETEDNLVSRGDVAAVRELLLARLAEQKKALTVAETGVTAKKKARDDARKAVAAAANLPPKPGSGSVTDTAAGGPTGKQHKVAVGIELLSPTGDPAQGYRLHPRHSAFRDDDHKLTISPSGLLTTLDVIAVDRTADALVELAAFAGAISNQTGATGRSGRDKCAGVPEEVTAIVDFANPTSVDNLNLALGCMGARIRLVDEREPFPPPVAEQSGAAFHGILYRTPIDVLVKIEKCAVPGGKCDGEEDWFPTQVMALSLPQAGPISQVPQNAGLFTKTTYGLAFKDGILTSYNSNRPSEVLEVARTPMRLVNAFFDGASKIISLRTGQSNAQVEALGARKKLTEAELAAMQAEAKRDAVNRCINDKIAKGEPPDTCYATQ